MTIIFVEFSSKRTNVFYKKTNFEHMKIAKII